MTCEWDSSDTNTSSNRSTLYRVYLYPLVPVSASFLSASLFSCARCLRNQRQNKMPIELIPMQTEYDAL